MNNNDKQKYHGLDHYIVVKKVKIIDHTSQEWQSNHIDVTINVDHKYNSLQYYPSIIAFNNTIQNDYNFHSNSNHQYATDIDCKSASNTYLSNSLNVINQLIQPTQSYISNIE